jgi:hypothetical protein
LNLWVLNDAVVQLEVKIIINSEWVMIKNKPVFSKLIYYTRKSPREPVKNHKNLSPYGPKSGVNSKQLFPDTNAQCVTVTRIRSVGTGSVCVRVEGRNTK